MMANHPINVLVIQFFVISDNTVVYWDNGVVFGVL